MGAATRILLVILLTAAAVVAWWSYGPRQSAEADQPAMARVRVAAEPLRVGTFLTDARAPFVERPAATVAETWIEAGEPDALGAVIIAPVAAGEPVSRGALLAPGQEGFLAAVLRPGFRAVALGVDEESGAAGNIFPGDRVDLLLTQEIRDEAAGEVSVGRRWASETILRNVRVIAVDQRVGGVVSAEREAIDDRKGLPRTVTLEVTADGAEAIAVARNLGALSLTLRSLVVEGFDGREPDASAGPTWAQDVSAVTRAAIGAATPGEAAPEPAVAPGVTVIRGAREKEERP